MGPYPPSLLGVATDGSSLDPEWAVMAATPWWFDEPDEPHPAAIRQVPRRTDRTMRRRTLDSLRVEDGGDRTDIRDRQQVTG